MQSIYRAALGMFAAAFWMGAAPAPQVVGGYRTMDGDGTYVDPSNGFSLGVPAFTRKTQERSVVVWFQAPPQSGFSSNVNVLVDPVRTTRLEYLKNSLDTLKKTNPGAKYNSRHDLEVSGREAELLDYEISLGGRRLRFLQLLVIDEDAAYVVTCTAPQGIFATYEAEFHRCLESFRLLHMVSE